MQCLENLFFLVVFIIVPHEATLTFVLQLCLWSYKYMDQNKPWSDTESRADSHCVL